MDSRRLTERGFVPWRFTSPTSEKSLLASLPRTYGVYAVRGAEHIRMPMGESDVRYIGKAANANGVRGRWRQYFHPGPTQTTNHFILRHLKQEVYEMAFIPVDDPAHARLLEERLLREFAREHGQKPPWNKSF